MMVSSCDAIIFLHYEVKNATGKDLQIRVRNDAYNPYSSSSDYKVVPFPKNESIIVGTIQGIGFPWEKRILHKNNPKCNCFTIVDDHMYIDLDTVGVKWKFKRGASVFNLKANHLINP